MKNILKVLFILTILILPMKVFASEKTINIHLFYGNGCPHCAKEEEFLNEYVKENSNVKVYMHEVWYDFSNQKLWTDVQKELKKNANGVPYTVIGNQTLTGFDEVQTKRDIKYLVNYYQTHDYRDIVGEMTGIVEKQEDIKMDDKNILDSVVHVPVLGDINPRDVSLPIIAAVMGLVDGFNPCAMWILLFLISMLIGMKDKKKLWTLGLTFIITSGVVYGLFMVAWLSLAMFITKISYIRVLIVLTTFVVGGWNLKNYFIKKNEDGCEVIDDKKRKSVINRIKDVTKQNKFILAIIGVILLAASVNVVELLCSIGLPMMFTSILSVNDLTTIQYLLYILLYIFFFLLIDIVIFAIAVITFKVTGISTKLTKYSHLIGGIIMVLIGIFLLLQWY